MSRSAEGERRRRARGARAADWLSACNTRRAARQRRRDRRAHAGRLRGALLLRGAGGRAPTSHRAIRARSAGASPPRSAPSTRWETCRWSRSQRRRRFHVQRAGAGDGGAPPHPGGVHRVQRRCLRQRPQHAEEPAWQPPHRQRSRQSRLRAARRELRHRGPSRQRPGSRCGARWKQASPRTSRRSSRCRVGDMPKPWQFIDMPKVRG